MMQQEVADDYLICTGQSISLRSIVEYVFDKLQISREKIRINQQFFRPNEIADIYGSNTKAVSILNWDFENDFFKVIDIILDEELRNYKVHGKN